MKTDLKLAKEFFKRLHEKGLDVRIQDYSGRKADFDGNEDEEFDWNAMGFEVQGSYGTCHSYDFLNGKFYRIMGFTEGNWQDEIDWKKYI